MSVAYKRLKGFADLHGPLAQAFTGLENTAKNIFSRYGFDELRTPILEATGLFQRSIGDETDVVQKEMFTFLDRKGRSMTLRPEATAGVMRACIEDGLVQPGHVSRFFSIGPMFRYERPQKGRMRQFHQINCECLGTDSPYADAEIISMLLVFLKALGLENLALKLNSLGCAQCRPGYLKLLGDFLRKLPEESLCEDCLRRREANPLRVLDCKQPGCRAQLENAPRLFEHNCASCRGHFDKTVELLDLEGISWERDDFLVRGLDYYQKIAFEVVSNEIGAQTAVAGGGRYDGLLGQLGGPDLPGIGFACGMERLALLLKVQQKPGLDFYILALTEDLRSHAFLLAEDLRAHGFSGEMNYSAQSFRSAMRQADRSGAAFCLFFGEGEAASNAITIKDMASGEQRTIPQSELTGYMRNSLAGSQDL